MNALLKKHYRLLFLLACIYPIYVDIFNMHSMINWFYKTTMQFPYIHLKKHEVIAILLYATNISLIISIIAIGADEYDFFMKIDLKFLKHNVIFNVISALIFGAISYFIPLGMDFIQDNQKTSSTHLFLIGFLSILLSILILNKYMNHEATKDRKDKVIAFLIKLLAAFFCIYLFIKPTSVEVYKNELSAIMLESDDAKFKKEIMHLLKKSEEDNAQITEEAFMLLEPFRIKSTIYASSYGNLLPDLCTPQALQKIAELTHRNYPYQLRSSLRHAQGLSKDVVDSERCDAAVNSVVFFNRIATTESLLINACNQNLLTWCQK